LAESAALLVFWRLNELVQSRAVESEARTRQVIETALDAVISFDEHGQITEWNRQAEAIFQWTCDEAVGQEFSQLILSAPYREAHTRAVQQCVDTGDVEVLHRRMQIVALRRDGTWFPAEVAMSPLRRQTYMFTAFVQDISERKLVEEELKGRAAELRAANDELEAFSYSVSHDLRAPLRHIEGFAGLLQKRAGSTLDERASRYLQSISDSAKQMNQLIDALLQLSRVGRDEMLTSQVALDPLVKGVLEDLHDEAASRDIVWSIDPLPSVRADPALLRQVFVNLIANALKYTGKRSPARIDIGCDMRADEIVVFVRDNGVGFDMQYAHRLFGVFQRLHRRDEFEGTGIGLALVRRIVMRHGGRTWAEGTTGHGATFFFSLPLSPLVHAGDPSPDLSDAVRSNG
jgi:PAS domain S-box-containing protein